MDFLSAEVLQKIGEYAESIPKSVEFWATLVAACGDSHRVAHLGYRLAYRVVKHAAERLKKRFQKRVVTPICEAVHNDESHLEADIGSCFGDPDL